MYAIVGEYRVCASHLQRCCVIGADSDRRRTARVDDTGEASKRRHVVIANHMGKRYGCDVERVCKGVGGRNHSGILASHKITRHVRLAVCAEILGVVVDLGQSSERPAGPEIGAVKRSIVGGGEYEWFE